MRCTWPTKRDRTDGFTLIEMLIIAPIVILAIGGFVALMVSMVGDVLFTRDQNAMTYNVQAALDQVEQDIRLGTQFLTTTDDLETPQGSNNNFTGNAPFTVGDGSFILSAVATDENPTSSTRWLVYYANQPNPCDGSESHNRIFLMKIVYFIKDGDLWRRTILPDYNTDSPANGQTICDRYGYGIWQQNSCSPGYAASTRCETNDSLVMENIDTFDVQYFAEPGDTVPLADSDAKAARTVKVTISGKKKTAGELITASGSVRATRLNNIDNSIPPPATPTVSYTLSGPASAKFTWNNIPTANSYEISYNVNGGDPNEFSLDSDTHSYTVDASRNDTITFKVAAKNIAGPSEYATVTATMPSWTALDLQGDWQRYSDSYNAPMFTRTTSGRVFLKGLIKSSTATSSSGTVIATLPPGYRPAGALVFPTSTSPDTDAKIDVQADGDIIFFRGNNNWISLEGISFLPASTPYSWQNLTLYNGWTNWGGSYEDARATIDNIGRVNLQGTVRAGTQTSNTAIARTSDISSAYLPPKSLHFPAGSQGTSVFWIWYADGEVTKRGPQSSDYLGIQALWYPSGKGSWQTATLQGAWVNYGGNYPILQYTKAADGVVTLRGLVQNGSTDSVIATLPAGYRPAETALMTSVCSDAYCRYDIQEDGDIVFRSGSTGWVAINQSFIPDQ